jgi:hypothetical protein
MYIVKLKEVVMKEFTDLSELKKKIDKIYADHLSNMTIDNIDQLYHEFNGFDSSDSIIPNSAYYYLNNIYDIKGKKEINLIIYDGFSKDFYKLMKKFKKYDIEIMIDKNDIHYIKMNKYDKMDENIIEKIYNIQYNYLIKRKVYNKMYNLIIEIENDKDRDYLISKMDIDKLQEFNELNELDSDEAFNMYDLIKDNYHLTYNMKKDNYQIKNKEEKIKKLYNILKGTDEIIEMIGVEKEIIIDNNYVNIYDKERIDRLLNIYNSSDKFNIKINVLDNKLYYNYNIGIDKNKSSNDEYGSNIIYLLNKISIKRIKLLICKYNKL